MNSLDGPRKDTIESLQKQIDFYFGEIYRLKRTQNSHVAISRLPAEMLSEIFLYVVEDGIENAVRFAAGTFNFLQICKRWNEVAINFPRLWVWWIPGAVKAWPLFNTRAKNAPLFLTVRSYVPILTKDAVMNPAIPRKIHQLDFAGTQQQLVDFLDAIGSNPPSNAWSIRLQVPPSNYSKLLEHLARFLSSPFPKLSKLDIEDFTPDSTSPIFTTSNLTSLKLSLSLTGKFRYTLSQFSQILQHHPNLRELDLQQSGTTVPEPSGPLVPLVLPRLVDLRLYSTEPTITGLIDLIGVSSPLHNVVIHFQNGYTLTPSLTNTMKKILAAYHGCAGLDSPRTVNHLSISSRLLEGGLTIDAESHSTSASQPMSNLRLQFDRTWDGLVGKILPLFQLNHVREFTVTRLGLVMGDWRRMFRKMKRLLCLRLDSLDIKPALEALCFDDPGVYKEATKISLSHLRRYRQPVSTVCP